MATELAKHSRIKHIFPNTTILEGFIEIGAAGAVNSSTGQRNSGAATVVKGAGAGEYTVTLHRAYRRVLNADANLLFPVAATGPTLADGNQAFVQGITVAMMNGASGCAGFTVQCSRTDTQAKANPTNGNIIHWRIEVSDSASN